MIASSGVAIAAIVAGAVDHRAGRRQVRELADLDSREDGSSPQGDTRCAGAIGPTTVALAQLTGADFPAPAASTHRTAGGLSAEVTPLDKVPVQYRERREYVNDDEESRYQLTLRYQPCRLGGAAYRSRSA